MTLEYLTKCICEHRELTKATPSLTATIQSVVANKVYIQKFGSSTVLWADKEQADAFEGYRPLGKRNITETPIIEVMNAIMIAVEQRISVKRGELRLAVARKWGAYRGVKVNKMLDEVIDILFLSPVGAAQPQSKCSNTHAVSAAPKGAQFVFICVYPGFHFGLCPHATLGYAGVACLRHS